jgi:hypothetical protein
VHFVPIPTTHAELNKAYPLWFPFLADISRRSKEPVSDLLAQIARLEVELALIWDGEKAHALVGIRYRQRGDEVVGEICWLTGKGMHNWRHLLPEIEQYLTRRGCNEIKPICRPGWAPFLKQHGYHITHLMMEKKL